MAPCLECGSEDIQLSDNNYSSFNQGGGKCKTCGHTTYAGVGCLPKIDDLYPFGMQAMISRRLLKKNKIRFWYLSILLMVYSKNLTRGLVTLQ